MDFVHDQLATGGKFRILTVIGYVGERIREMRTLSILGGFQGARVSQYRGGSAHGLF